ncbi:hypothetical protein HYFRA_00008536 [Hymenoscyphus fraxineus]|uniref:Ubiquitin 3 binding protein But2 C-terminal domain-containing protein n=1 Tax=Hymenoscyphus fraxineus TaxID=746836 RepID=A0A9N9KV43_9HELO|nr:hypothetical protein HYFRA_00008536 [Hymenoscyphus fraxineus]
MFSYFFPGLLVVLTTVLSVVAQNVSGVVLRGVSHGGQACPQGSTDFTLSVDKKSITAKYTAFTLSSTNSYFQRKNCQINLDIAYPAGLQYAVSDTTFSDSVNFEKGASAQHRILYYFSGSSDQTSLQHSYNGPLHGELSNTEVSATGDQIWSPCGGSLPLNINNAVVLRGSGPGKIDVRSVSSGLVWRTC